MQIKKILILMLYTCLSFPASIIIDPAGDSRTMGRTVGDSFEQSVTYQLALNLKKELEKDGNNVLLTRSASQIITPLQNAHFANRINPDLYITIHCYHNPDEKFSIALYSMSQGQPFINPLSPFSLIAINKAHWSNKHETEKITQAVYITLVNSYGQQFVIRKPVALPLVALNGITAPAISIELNCLKSNDISQYSIPLAHALTNALAS